MLVNQTFSNISTIHSFQKYVLIGISLFPEAAANVDVFLGFS